MKKYNQDAESIISLENSEKIQKMINRKNIYVKRVKKEDE